jgi:CubicO group peptidase (beta-lactamase class C family)
VSSDFPPYAPSETLGFLPDRLERLTAIIEREIEGRAPGAVMMIARGGKIAYRQCVGRLRSDGPPMTEDAIFRIYSMTKPIVSVAAMQLVEEGRFSIGDPVSAFIPAFADLKVGVERDGRLDLEPLTRPITIQDLLRHTSGLTYGFTGASAVQKLYAAADLRNESRTTPEQVEAIAALPLFRQPGTKWEYGVSTDVLGRVLEIVTGRSLGEVLQEQIFGPLRMIDTGFFTPESKLARRAEPFASGFAFMRKAGVGACDATSAPKFESGGGGLLSTLADYTRFCAMLANGGELNGVRILGPRTRRFMACDHLDATVDRKHSLLWPGHGFGLGFAVRTAPGLAHPGSVGEHFWGGMMGTAFWMSPADDLFAIFMIQSPEHRDYFRVLYRTLVSAAIA